MEGFDLFPIHAEVVFVPAVLRQEGRNCELCSGIFVPFEMKEMKFSTFKYGGFSHVGVLLSFGLEGYVYRDRFVSVPSRKKG